MAGAATELETASFVASTARAALPSDIGAARRGDNFEARTLLSPPPSASHGQTRENNGESSFRGNAPKIQAATQTVSSGH